MGINDWYPTYGIEIPSLDFKSFLSPTNEENHYALMNLLQIPEKEFDNRSKVFEIMAKWGKLRQGNPRASLQNVSAVDFTECVDRTSQHLKGSAAELSLEEFCELEQMDCWDEEEPVILILDGMHGMTEVGIVCINCD